MVAYAMVEETVPLRFDVQSLPLLAFLAQLLPSWLVMNASWKSRHPFRKLRSELEFMIIQRENSVSFKIELSENRRVLEPMGNLMVTGSGEIELAAD